MPRLLILAVLAAGCASSAPAEPPWDFDGFCQPFDEEGPDVEHVQLFRGEVFPNMDDEAGVQVIVDAGNYENMVQRWGVTPTEQVDFETQQVVAAWAGVSSTCGLLEDRFRVMRIADVTVVDLTVDDTSGACESACDMTMALGAIIALPRGERARGCSRVRDTCPE